MSKRQKKENNSALYTFLISEAAGAMKSIHTLSIKSIDNKYVLVPKNGGEPIEIEPIERPFSDSEKVKWGFRALFIPILVSLFIFLLGARFLIYFNAPAVFVLGVLYAITVADVVYFLYRLRSYRKGMAAETKHDYIKTMSIGLLSVVIVATSFFSTAFGYIESTSAILGGLWYIFFMELIKKPLLIMFSEGVQYWEYFESSTEKDYILISPKNIIQTKGTE